MTNDITVANPVFSQVHYDYRQPERVFFNPYNSGEIWVSSFGNGMRMGNLTVTGTHEASLENKLNVFPNPARNFITVSSESEGELRLYNLEGLLVGSYPVGSGSTQVPLRSLEAGIYVARLNGNVGKVVKE